jgi:DNA-directed RNA polymerase subunit RPC12/RpoP
MPTIFHCPSCGRKLRGTDELRGRRVKCPKCSAIIEAVARETEPAQLPPFYHKVTPPPAPNHPISLLSTTPPGEVAIRKSEDFSLPLFRRRTWILCEIGVVIVLFALWARWHILRLHNPDVVSTWRTFAFGIGSSDIDKMKLKNPTKDVILVLKVVRFPPEIDALKTKIVTEEGEYKAFSSTWFNMEQFLFLMFVVPKDETETVLCIPDHPRIEFRADHFIWNSLSWTAPL